MVRCIGITCAQFCIVWYLGRPPRLETAERIVIEIKTKTLNSS